jgi:hypothetical protein
LSKPKNIFRYNITSSKNWNFKNFPEVQPKKETSQWPFLASAETKNLAGMSRATGAAELIEMAQCQYYFEMRQEINFI